MKPIPQARSPTLLGVIVSVAAKKCTKMADHFDEAFRHCIPASKDGVKAKPFRSLHEP
jgi:hypothetical protein